jgi:hypothetical protein
VRGQSTGPANRNSDRIRFWRDKRMRGYSGCNLREREAFQAELVNIGGTGIRDNRRRAGRADPK